MTRVCVDASFVLALLIPPERTPDVIGTWRAMVSAGDDIIGPPLLFIEVTSVLRECIVQGQMTAARGERAFEAFQRLPIRRSWPQQLHSRAWEIVKRLNQRKAYDAHYLALAEIEGCPLWTLDQRLASTAAQRLPRVKIMTPGP